MALVGIMKNDLMITKEFTVKEALKKLDETAEKVLMVVDSHSKLIGTITDGDIRRAILSGKNFNDSISGVYNCRPLSISESNFDLDLVKGIFIHRKIELLPIVDTDMKIVDFITWNSAFSESRAHIFPAEKICEPVVIMAGGKGVRLHPITKVLPKPLIPLGEKTIAELIIERFQNFGVEEFFLTLNYKGEMIKAYFDSMVHGYKLHYVFEADYLGTAGSLKLIQDTIGQTFIVSNCDILVKVDYAKIMRYHKDKGACLTIVSAFQHHKIPYGVINFKKDGYVVGISEKPEKTFPINTGVYIFEHSCLDYIPVNTYFDMTDLIDLLLKEQKIICTYPVNANDYIDIGQWDYYKDALEKFKL